MLGIVIIDQVDKGSDDESDPDTGKGELKEGNKRLAVLSEKANGKPA